MNRRTTLFSLVVLKTSSKSDLGLSRLRPRLVKPRREAASAANSLPIDRLARVEKSPSTVASLLSLLTEIDCAGKQTSVMSPDVPLVASERSPTSETTTHRSKMSALTAWETGLFKSRVVSEVDAGRTLLCRWLVTRRRNAYDESEKSFGAFILTPFLLSKSRTLLGRDRCHAF